jgi:RNA polymerase sigma-70 factor, ECF subfamily
VLPFRLGQDEIVTRMTSLKEKSLLARLRQGDEAAFTELVDSLHTKLVRFARGFVHDDATAQDVVQEAWLGALNGLATFEGRSSLSSWIFSITANKAKTRAVRDARTTPFSALAAQEASDSEYAVSPDRFLDTSAEWPGHWAQPPAAWDRPEERLLQTEIAAELFRIVDGLPPAQRAVLLLRDVEGYGAGAVCNILDLSETNVRVLLHRARSKVRGALEAYLT